MPVKAQQVATTCFAWWRLGGIMCAFRQREPNNIVVIAARTEYQSEDNSFHYYPNLIVG